MRRLGTLTLLGSMVQKGKFSAGMPILVRTLNRVDLPTLGSPTKPICDAASGVDQRDKALPASPIMGSAGHAGAIGRAFCGLRVTNQRPDAGTAPRPAQSTSQPAAAAVEAAMPRTDLQVALEAAQHGALLRAVIFLLWRHCARCNGAGAAVPSCCAGRGPRFCWRAARRVRGRCSARLKGPMAAATGAQVRPRGTWCVRPAPRRARRRTERSERDSP